MEPHPTNVYFGFKGKSVPMDRDVGFATFVTPVAQFPSMIQASAIFLPFVFPIFNQVSPARGGGGLAGFNSNPALPLLNSADWRLDRSDWRLNPAIFSVFSYWAADAYGMEALIDVFASSSNAQLPIFGLPALKAYHSTVKMKGLIYVNGDWADYERVIDFIASLQVVALVVAPFWTQKGWFSRLVGAATHCWMLQKEVESFLPLSREHREGIGPAPWQVGRL